MIILFIPTIIEKSFNKEYAYDLYSRLLKDRIVFLTGEITDNNANIIIGQLLYLDSLNNEDIYLYINSPGGSITAGMSIYDTMNYIKSDVRTIALGMSASMAAFILSSGAKGKRYALPNSEIMIHQPLGGAQGQATEIKRSTSFTRARVLSTILLKSRPGNKLYSFSRSLITLE